MDLRDTYHQCESFQLHSVDKITEIQDPHIYFRPRRSRYFKMLAIAQPASVKKLVMANLERLTLRGTRLRILLLRESTRDSR